MKKIVVITTLMLLALVTNAQNATQARMVLDKTAKIVGNKNGASSSFTINGKY